MSLLSIVFHNASSSELSTACDLQGVEKCILSLKTTNKYT